MRRALLLGHKLQDTLHGDVGNGTNEHFYGRYLDLAFQEREPIPGL